MNANAIGLCPAVVTTIQGLRTVDENTVLRAVRVYAGCAIGDLVMGPDEGGALRNRAIGVLCRCAQTKLFDSFRNLVPGANDEAIAAAILGGWVTLQRLYESTETDPALPRTNTSEEFPSIRSDASLDNEDGPGDPKIQDFLVVLGVKRE
jgi:hypothetical protein